MGVSRGGGGADLLDAHRADGADKAGTLPTRSLQPLTESHQVFLALKAFLLGQATHPLS